MPGSACSASFLVAHDPCHFRRRLPSAPGGASTTMYQRLRPFGFVTCPLTMFSLRRRVDLTEDQVSPPREPFRFVSTPLYARRGALLSPRALRRVVLRRPLPGTPLPRAPPHRRGPLACRWA